MNKRGISPLIATVLLIAFSVALGAVVMSWGQTYIEDHLQVGGGETFGSGCDSVSLGVLKIGDEEQACLSPEAVQLFLSNGPNMDLVSVKAQVIGSDVLNVQDILQAPLARDSSVKASIPYYSLSAAEHKDLGLVKQVVLIPYIVQNGQPMSCAAKAVAVSQLKGC